MEEMKRLGWLMLSVLLIGLLIASVWFRIADAKITAWCLSADLELGSDSANYAVDSVVFRSFHYREAANARFHWLAKGIKCTIADSNTNSTFSTDSLCYGTIVPIDSFQDYTSQYNFVPNVVAWVYWNDGQISRADVHMAPVMYPVTVFDTVSTGDTIAVLPVSATATIDYDTLATIVLDTAEARQPGTWSATGSGGTGAFPETLIVYDSVGGAGVNDAVVHVKSVDTSSYQNSSGPQTTQLVGLNDVGAAIFSLDAGTFPVAVSAQGYYQESAYQLVTQASPGGRDTVWLYSVSPSTPSGGDSCNVVIFTEKQGSYAVFDPTPAVTQDTTQIFLDLQKFRKDADAIGVIQQALPRSAATSKVVKWNVTVYGPNNNTIGAVKPYTVPNQTVDTLVLQ